MIELIYKQYEIVKKIFNNLQFHMTKSVFQNIEGQIFVDNIDHPNYSCILLKNYCFVNGNCNEEFLNNFFNWLPSNITVFNFGKEWASYFEKKYNNQYEKYTRYVMKNPNNFNIEMLNNYINKIDYKYKLKKIDKYYYDKINNTNSFCTNLGMSINYEQNGLGYCCLENTKIVGVITSNIIYKDGIEINIKINPDKRRQGIATALSSKLILKCIEKKCIPYWDAANDNSLGLALKLGYTKELSYNVYMLKNRK